jgi:hypothetical protein
MLPIRGRLADQPDMQFASPVYEEPTENPQFNKSHSSGIVNGNGYGVRDTSPPPKLERVTEGSIPVSLIADRVIRKSYGNFLNLAET